MTVTTTDLARDLLSPAEHRAMELTAELWNLLAGEVVAAGTSRTGDMRELCGHIHAVQHAILAQAAGRAYPEMYRLLGGDAPRPAPSPPRGTWRINCGIGLIPEGAGEYGTQGAAEDVMRLHSGACPAFTHAVEFVPEAVHTGE